MWEYSLLPERADRNVTDIVAKPLSLVSLLLPPSLPAIANWLLFESNHPKLPLLHAPLCKWETSPLSLGHWHLCGSCSPQPMQSVSLRGTLYFEGASWDGSKIIVTLDLLLVLLQVVLSLHRYCGRYCAQNHVSCFWCSTGKFLQASAMLLGFVQYKCGLTHQLTLECWIHLLFTSTFIWSTIIL